MSKVLVREKEKSLQIDAIGPEEVRKRARAAQCSGLTSGLLSRSNDSRAPTSGRGSAFAHTSTQNRGSFSNLTCLNSRLPVLHEGEEALRAGLAEEHIEDVISPGSRPIQRKARTQKRTEEPQSDLSKSLPDDEFIPPHLLSLPAEPFYPKDPCSQPGSLYEGAGRKLRGMDAVRFRRNVMRQTGFLEPSAENAVH